ncbi:PKD domain-containing protein [Epilithonimonas sp.]|uniref:PKD domain-containing protein n=1 Tax=Epilithonimonas sp. TaxID=2894511 RepID=UPI00289E8AA3|nr:PKD domain-containing protein [Epilithonimonas sp.]
MKLKIIYLSLLFFTVLTINSCRKVEESIVDCLGESILTSLRHEVSTSNVKQVDFEISYSGEKTVTSIAWDFGDGIKTTSTNKKISHTYTTGGTYEVKTDVSLENGKCTVSPKKSVIID